MLRSRGLAPKRVLQADLASSRSPGEENLPVPAPSTQPAACTAPGFLHPVPANPALPSLVQCRSRSYSLSMAQKHAAQLGALPGCAEPRYFPVLMKPSLAKLGAQPCRLLCSRPGNLPVHGRAQTFVSKTFRRRPGLNLFFCSISPASETGVTVFLSAALCIHLVCLDPDPPGALEIRSGSSSRPCTSQGPAGAAAITAHSPRIRIRHHPMQTTRALRGTAGKNEPAGAAVALGTGVFSPPT